LNDFEILYAVVYFLVSVNAQTPCKEKKGVTKPISFPFSLTGGIKDNRGNIRLGVAAETKINRRDYGIAWGAKMANGGLNVADEVIIDLQLEAVKAAAPATQ
jgi:hypothetical protein